MDSLVMVLLDGDLSLILFGDSLENMHEFLDFISLSCSLDC